MLPFLIYFILISLTRAKSLIHTPENNDSFDSCFANIVNKCLHHHTNILIGPKFKEMRCSYSRPMKIVSSAEILFNTNQQGAGSYAISYNFVEELNETLTEVSTLNLIHYIIIANDQTELRTISKYLWQFQLHKSVILLPVKHTVELYVIDLKNSNCGTDIKPKKINQCVNGTFRRKLNLFSPDVKKCFHKCPFRIIWSKYSPWIFGGNDTETGVYQDILSLYQERNQFNVIYMPESEVYSEELAYYNFRSIITDFDRGYADLFLGLVGFTASSTYVWVTGFVYDDNLYFVVPNPKMIPYWKLMFKLFIPAIWICGGMLFFILSVLFTLLALTTADRARFGNLIDNIFYLYALIINVGFYELPRSLKLRLYLGVYLLNVIILLALVQGKYFSFISSPVYEKRISNVEQLLDSDVPIKFMEGLKVLFMFPIGNKRNARVLQRIEVLPDNDLAVNLERAYNENFATITDRGLLIMNPFLKNSMQVFKILSFVTCFVMKKNHVLNEHFTTSLTTIVESGFVQKFVSLMKFKYSLHQFFKDETKIFGLTLSHVEGPFLLLFVGYIVSTSCFIIEHIYFYLKKTCTQKDKSWYNVKWFQKKF